MERLLFIPVFFIVLSPILWNLPQPWIVALVLGTGFPHIFLGIKYSRKGTERSWSFLASKCILCFLIPISLIFGFAFEPIGLILFFALHHALSETYGHGQNTKPFVTLTRFLLIITTYLIACQGDVFIAELPLVFSGVPALLALLLLHQVTRAQVKLADAVIQSPWIVGAPVVMALSTYQSIPWEAFILFHFAFWGALPLFRKSMFRNNAHAKRMFWRDALIWNGSGLALFCALTLFSFYALDFRIFELSLLAFYSMTYWHISASFFISKANPSWLNSILQRTT